MIFKNVVYTVSKLHKPLLLMKIVFLYCYYFKGPAIYYAASGASEERTYCDGISHGPATLYLPNGDSEERMYENGKLHGIATFVSNAGDRYVMIFEGSSV